MEAQALAVSADGSKPIPMLVRKLRRKADWISRAEGIQERAQDLFEKLFGGDQLPYSLYQSNGETELQRIGAAMNARRLGNKLADEAFFVEFPLSDVVDANIAIAQTPGETSCQLVNSRHVDLNGTEAQFLDLLLAALQAGRQPVHLTKAVMALFLRQATDEQCRIIPTATGDCTAAGCRPSD